MKKWIKTASLVLATLFVTMLPMGCNKNKTNGAVDNGVGNANLPAFNREEYFYGAGELASEVGPKGDWRDEGVTMEWTSNTSKALGVESQRVWMHLNTVIQRAEKSNELSLIQSECDRYHEYFARLKAAGVKRILVMNHRYIYPYGYNPGTAATVPEPMKDPGIYKTWLEMYSECYRMLAIEFPEIDFWECGNEFDLDSFMHKSDYNVDKFNSLYPQDEAAAITADLCYAAKKGVTAVDAYNFAVFCAAVKFTPSNARSVWQQQEFWFANMFACPTCKAEMSRVISLYLSENTPNISWNVWLVAATVCAVPALTAAKVSRWLAIVF